MRSRISIRGYVRPSVGPSWNHAKVPFLTKTTTSSSENASYAVYPALFYYSFHLFLFFIIDIFPIETNGGDPWHMKAINQKSMRFCFRFRFRSQHVSLSQSVNGSVGKSVSPFFGVLRLLCFALPKWGWLIPQLIRPSIAPIKLSLLSF